MENKQFPEDNPISLNDLSNTVSASAVKSQAETSVYDKIKQNEGYKHSNNFEQMEKQEHVSLPSPKEERQPESHFDQVPGALGNVIVEGDSPSAAYVTVASGQPRQPSRLQPQTPAETTNATSETKSIVCLALGGAAVFFALTVVVVLVGVLAFLKGLSIIFFQFRDLILIINRPALWGRRGLHPPLPSFHQSKIVVF